MLTFDTKTILFGLFFGLVGFASWTYGRKNQSARHMWLGAALIGYSYLIPNPWLSLAIGLALTVLLFWP